MIMALLKSAKFWVISALVIAVLGFMKWGYGEIYQNGYNEAELKWRTAQQEAIDEAVADARRDTALVYAEAMRNIENETEIIERIRVVEREVPKIVKEYVIPECRDLGPDIQRVFNDAIAAASGQSLPAAGDTAVTDRALP